MRYIFLLLIFACNVAYSQSLNLDLGATGGVTSKVVQLIAIVTILSVAPSIVIMVTSFTRLIVVFSLLRTAIGLQQTPPNMVLASLALFLTFFIMAPTLEKSYNDGVKPLMEESLNEEAAFPMITKPFHEFMSENVREADLNLLLNIAKIEPKQKEDIPFHVLIPAFMLSELKRAFEIGFLVFLPFIVIDLLIASILMAMGMMMLPPVLISLPFKLIFFVLIDGWHMLCGSLIKSYGLS